MFFRVDRYCCGFRAPGDVVEARTENDCHLVDVGMGSRVVAILMHFGILF
jgi:hypothetical protein